MPRLLLGILATLAVAAPAHAAPSLVSATANGAPVAVSVDEHLGAGTASFQVAPGAGLDATAVYEIVIDTGTWQAREARVTGRGVNVAIAGNRVTIRLRPVAASWNPALVTCTGSGACGDALTRASEDLSGRAEGVLSDLRTAVPAGGPAIRAGFWEASNAQYHAPAVYDAAVRAVIVRLGNPHLRLDGKPATGAYEAFLPAAVLPSYLGITGTAAVDSDSLVVTRSVGGATTVVRAPAITRVGGGVELRIAGISYSTATYRVYGLARALPTKVRSLSVRRPAAARVRLGWKAPARAGAMPVTTYRVRCGSSAATVRGRSVIIRARAGVTCTIKPHSAAGYGPAVLKRV
ncbi:MAG: hypothetical protein QOE98_2998 [Gaiellaceae bacterium]|nr:hypothetical protein [Gaiellaceae bacterium]